MPRRSELPLFVALACVLGLVVVAWVALGWPAGHERDAAVLHGFTSLDRPSVEFELNVMTNLCDALPYAVAGLLCIGVALARGRRWRAVCVFAMLVGTGATTLALKHLLAQPRLEEWLGGPTNQVSDTSWPSGHSTAAMTLALCAIIVAPSALRAIATLLAGAFAIGVGYALVVLAWHFPSDVLGGYLVAGLWASFAVAVLDRVEAPEPALRLRWELQAALGLAAAAAVVAAAVVGVRSDDVALYTMERPSLVAGALVIALLALALVTTVSAASTRGAPRAR